MPIYDLQPNISLFTYLAPNATIIGEVMIGSECMIWYGSVIRGDMNQITLILHYIFLNFLE